MDEFRGHFATPSQKRSRGGFWMDLGRIFGGFWKDLGVLGAPNGNENRYISKKIQALPQDHPGKALGRVLEGFGVFWGRFWEVLEGFFKDFSLGLVRVSCGILGNPREGG